MVGWMELGNNEVIFYIMVFLILMVSVSWMDYSLIIINNINYDLRDSAREICVTRANIASVSLVCFELYNELWDIINHNIVILDEVPFSTKKYWYFFYISKWKHVVGTHYIMIMRIWCVTSLFTLFNTYHMLWANSADDKLMIFFLFFLENRT